MKVIWTPRAQQRLQEIHDYIARDQPDNAVRWVARVLDRGEQIGDQPRSGRIVPEYQREAIREVFAGDSASFTASAVSSWTFSLCATARRCCPRPHASSDAQARMRCRPKTQVVATCQSLI